MIKESITLDEAIAFLNSLIKVDANAMEGLVLHKVPCNDDMVDHETVQVKRTEFEVVGHVGMLGILNGLFGIHGSEAGSKESYGPITAVFSSGADMRLQEFRRTTNHNPNPVRKDKSEMA